MTKNRLSNLTGRYWIALAGAMALLLVPTLVLNYFIDDLRYNHVDGSAAKSYLLGFVTLVRSCGIALDTWSVANGLIIISLFVLLLWRLKYSFFPAATDNSASGHPARARMVSKVILYLPVIIVCAWHLSVSFAPHVDPELNNFALMKYLHPDAEIYVQLVKHHLDTGTFDFFLSSNKIELNHGTYYFYPQLLILKAINLFYPANDYYHVYVTIHLTQLFVLLLLFVFFYHSLLIHFGITAAITGLLLLATTPAFFQDFLLYTTGTTVFMICFIFAGVHQAHQALYTSSRKCLYWAGVWAGLAFGAKYGGVFLLPIFGWVALVLVSREEREAKLFVKVWRAGVLLTAVCLVFVCTYAVTNPVPMLHLGITIPGVTWAMSPGNTVSQMRSICSFMDLTDSSTVLGQLALYYKYGEGLVRFAVWAFFFELLAWLYRLLTGRDRECSGIEVHLLFAALYVVVVSRVSIASARFALPVLPSLCYISAVFLYRSCRIVFLVVKAGVKYVMSILQRRCSETNISPGQCLARTRPAREYLGVCALLLLIVFMASGAEYNQFITGTGRYLNFRSNRFAPGFYDYIKRGFKTDILKTSWVSSSYEMQDTFCVGSWVAYVGNRFVLYPEYQMRSMYVSYAPYTVSIASLVRGAIPDLVLSFRTFSDEAAQLETLMTKDRAGFALISETAETMLYARNQDQLRKKTLWGADADRFVDELNRQVSGRGADVLDAFHHNKMFTLVGQEGFSAFDIGPITIGGPVAQAAVDTVKEVLEMIPGHYLVMVFADTHLPRVVFDPQSGTVKAVYKIFHENRLPGRPETISPRRMHFARPADIGTGSDFLKPHVFKMSLWREDKQAAYVLERINVGGTDIMICYGEREYVEACYQRDAAVVERVELYKQTAAVQDPGLD